MGFDTIGINLVIQIDTQKYHGSSKNVLRCVFEGFSLKKRRDFLSNALTLKNFEPEKCFFFF